MSTSVLERVVVFHEPDETSLAVACANEIAAATGVPVALAKMGDAKVRWWLFRDRSGTGTEPAET